MEDSQIARQTGGCYVAVLPAFCTGSPVKYFLPFVRGGEVG